MLKSRIEVIDGTPTLFINGKQTVAMAYTTYFKERSCYKDFLEAGYRIIFVNVSFTRSPINSTTGFTPFHVGVFEDPDVADYSEFEDMVRKILDECPDAIIFPRIYASMPKWWVDSHPEDTVMTAKGGRREALFSEAFRRDGSELLTRLVRHIKSADYSHRIGGWQICGGMTQEWFHHDYNGSLKASKEPYRRWVKTTYGEDDALPPAAKECLYNGQSYNECENARRYSLFANLGVAETIDIFAKVIKDEVAAEQIVGAFYGYSFENNGCAMFGTHALRRLLDSPNMDFFSSPNAYTHNRIFGIDWADMIPVDSVRGHGKICFIECDIRTYLTTDIQEARPGEYPDNLYRSGGGVSVWAGPPTAELSREALRKCFAHQITKASAIWWFDMWGGWYHDPLLMQELADMKKIYDRGIRKTDGDLCPEVVLFADETAYANLSGGSPLLGGIAVTRTSMGNTGAPYDSCMVEDAGGVLRNYRAAVFAMPIPSEAGKRAMELCEELGIPYLCATPQRCGIELEEIKDFLTKSGIHLYSMESDVVYAGHGYLGLHSASAGKKTLKLPRVCTVSAVFGADIPTMTTDTVTFELSENATALFYVTK